MWLCKNISERQIFWWKIFHFTYNIGFGICCWSVDYSLLLLYVCNTHSYPNTHLTEIICNTWPFLISKMYSSLKSKWLKRYFNFNFNFLKSIVKKSTHTGTLNIAHRISYVWINNSVWPLTIVLKRFKIPQGPRNFYI